MKVASTKHLLLQQRTISSSLAVYILRMFKLLYQNRPETPSFHFALIAVFVDIFVMVICIYRKLINYIYKHEATYHLTMFLGNGREGLRDLNTNLLCPHLKCLLQK